MTTIIVKNLVIKGKKFRALGVGPLPAITAILVVIYCINNLNYSYTSQFDKIVWAGSEEKPLGMVVTLAKENKLIGMTRSEVIEMLGKGKEESFDETAQRGWLLYSVKNNWRLIIRFENNRVKETVIKRPGLFT